MRPAPGFGRARAGRQGFTLLELLMVLGALAVVLGVLLPGTGMIRTGRIQAIVQDVGTLRHAADRWIERGRLDYAGITVTALKNEGLLPGGWAATNPYGGPYAVAPSAGDATHLTVTVAGLAPSVGTTLVSAYTGRVQSVSFASGTLTVTF